MQSTNKKQTVLLTPISAESNPGYHYSIETPDNSLYCRFGLQPLMQAFADLSRDLENISQPQRIEQRVKQFEDTLKRLLAEKQNESRISEQANDIQEMFLQTARLRQLVDSLESQNDLLRMRLQDSSQASILSLSGSPQEYFNQIPTTHKAEVTSFKPCLQHHSSSLIDHLILTLKELFKTFVLTTNALLPHHSTLRNSLSLITHDYQKIDFSMHQSSYQEAVRQFSSEILRLSKSVLKLSSNDHIKQR